MRIPNSVAPMHTDERGLKQYLRATEMEIGMLFNFGPRAEFERYISENDKKNPRESASIRGKELQ
jgi:hypothetical protein